MQETQVRSLGWEDPLEEIATHSSLLAWRIPCAEEPGVLQSIGSQRARQDWATERTLMHRIMVILCHHFSTWLRCDPWIENNSELPASELEMVDEEHRGMEHLHWIKAISCQMHSSWLLPFFLGSALTRGHLTVVQWPGLGGKLCTTHISHS